MSDKRLHELKELLVEGIVDDKGLSYIVSQLQARSCKSVYICDIIGRVLVAHVADGYRGQIPDRFDVPPVSYRQYAYDEGQQRLVVSINREKNMGYIIADPIESEEVKEIAELLQAADLALRVYFSKMNEINYVESQYKGFFVQDLLFNNMVDHEEILQKGKLWGWDLKQKFFVALVNPDDSVNLRWFAKEFEHIGEMLKRKYEIEMMTVFRNGSFVLLCQEENRAGSSIQDGIISDLHAFNQIFTEKQQMTFSIAVGQSYVAYKEIYKSYQEAKTAMALIKILAEKASVKYFKKLGVMKLLYQQEAYVLKDFYHDTLQKVIDFDKSSNGELLMTMEGLIEHNMDWKRAAEALHIHVNTLRYRIKKAEEILQVDMTKLDDTIDLAIALKIRILLKFHYKEV